MSGLTRSPMYRWCTERVYQLLQKFEHEMSANIQKPMPETMNDSDDNDGDGVVVNEDAIDGTVYSRRWIMETIGMTMQLLSTESPTVMDEDELLKPEEIDEIQARLCILWDMSSNPDVHQALMDLNVHDFCIVCCFKTQLPRLAEILMGILGNLSYNDEICKVICECSPFRKTTIDWLSSRNTAFLLQVLRFLNTAMSKSNRSLWQRTININTYTFVRDTLRIFQLCLNVDVLQQLFMFINSLLYMDSDLGNRWLAEDTHCLLVSSMCQACDHLITSLKQSDSIDDDELDATTDSISASQCGFFYHFWFIIQTMFDEKYYETHFKSYTTELQELFFHYRHFLNESTNSLFSYSAACAFFVELYNTAGVSDVTVQAKMKLDMLQCGSTTTTTANTTTVATTHQKALNLSTENQDNLQGQINTITTHLEEFSNVYLS